MSTEIKPTNEELNLKLFDDSIIYLCDRISNFDIGLLVFVVSEKINFNVRVAYSFDNQHWSNPIDLLELEELSDFNDFLQIDTNQNFIPDVYISIWLNKFEIEASGDTMYVTKNIEDTIQRVTIENITYNSLPVTYKIASFKSVINQYPKWNLYDNQYVNVKNWLEQCVSLSKSYGFIAIYFKTLPTEINHTLQTTEAREVVSVKKILVQFPDNELPEDKNIYSEWDYALEGDNVLHLVDKNFKDTFGYDTVPNSKDYFYLPILNKMFKVSAVQPGKAFMGVSAWWEIYFSKYEDDETVTMSDDIMSAMSGFEQFDAVENMIEELDNFKLVNTLSKEEILEKTIDEKKEATENFTNILNDSTRFIDLKETELQREFYDKRLQIVSINPDNNAFPVTMYDCSTVTKRTVGLTYNLVDNVSINKKSLLLDKSLSLNFNYILQAKYSGEIFDILDSNNLPYITVESKRNKISIINHSTQITTEIDYIFLPLEYYQINLNYNKISGQLAVSIFILKNTQKKLEFQQVYINYPNNNNQHNNPINFSNIILFGGNYYIGEIYFFVNDEKILSDFVNPLLNMNKFGR